MESYWKRGFVTHLLPVENPFFAILGIKWVAIAEPLPCHWQPNGDPMAPKWVQSGHHSRLSGSIGAGQYSFIKLHIQSSLEFFVCSPGPSFDRECVLLSTISNLN